ncbi:MAG: HEAT repeat domain-containing protein [Planctomycetes bacterium]|nr:HEAT repeat domain-containing protein [Planctomycetota bacterium]
MRSGAIRGLSVGKTDASAAVLITAIGDADDEVRYLALVACGERRIAGCADAAVRALRDADQGVRVAAIAALAAIHAVNHRAHVRPLLADADQGVRYGAIIALSRLGDDEIDGIIVAVATLDPPLRAQLAGHEQALALDDRQRTLWRELTRAP